MPPLAAPPSPAPLAPPPAPRQPPKWPFLLGGAALGALNLSLKGDGLPVNDAERMGFYFGTILGGVLLGVVVWSLAARRWIIAGVLGGLLLLAGVAGVLAHQADSGAAFVDGCKRGCVRKAEKASPEMLEKMERVCGCLCERLDAQMSPELRKRTRSFDAKTVQEDPEMRSVMTEAVRQCMNTGANGAEEAPAE